MRKNTVSLKPPIKLGDTVRVRIPIWRRCDVCDGEGRMLKGYKRCPACNDYHNGGNPGRVLVGYKVIKSRLTSVSYAGSIRATIEDRPGEAFFPDSFPDWPKDFTRDPVVMSDGSFVRRPYWMLIDVPGTIPCKVCKKGKLRSKLLRRSFTCPSCQGTGTIYHSDRVTVEQSPYLTDEAIWSSDGEATITYRSDSYPTEKDAKAAARKRNRILSQKEMKSS